MYDFEIAVPSDTTRPQIKMRLEDFKKYGLLNTKDLRIHISFLGTKNCGESADFLKNDWPSNIDVDVIICPYSFTAQRIYNYYGKHIQKDFAKWYIRMDEDSITDLGGLMANLERDFDHNREYHLGSRFLYDIFATDQRILTKMGYGWWYRTSKSTEFMEAPAHEQEIGITSLAAINRLVENTDAKKYFNIRKEFAEGYGDHGLSYGLRMCKIYGTKVPFLTHESSICHHSIFSGHLNHIHWVGRDKNPQFMDWMEIYNDSPCEELKNKTFLFGSNENKELVEFCDDHRIKVFDDNSKDEEFIRTIGLWCVRNNKIVIIHEVHNNLIVFQKDKFIHEEYSMIEV